MVKLLVNIVNNFLLLTFFAKKPHNKDHDFINCPAFVDIKQTLRYELEIE